MIGMILINAISMLLGFVRDTSIVYKLGANSVSDTFLFTINLPTVIFSALGWVISTTFIPVYTDLKCNYSEKEANKFANNFLKVITLFSIIVLFLMEIFNKQIVRILAPGFIGERFQMASDIVPLILPAIICFGITYCFVGILNSYKKMMWTSAIGIPVNLFIIIGILFVYPRHGIKGAVLTALFGSIMQFVILILPLRETSYRYNLGLNLRDKYLLEAFRMIGPMIIGVMAQQINSLFLGMIASTLEVGSTTTLNLALKVIYSLYNSFIFIAIAFIFPYLSESVAKNKIEEFNSTIHEGLKLILVLTLPMTVLTIFFDKEIITILFGYGNFSKANINNTAAALVFFSLSFIFMAARDLLNRAFYAYKDTKTPTINSVISILVNIVLGVVLARFLSVNGLGIAMSSSMFVSALLLLKDINKKSRLFKNKKHYVGPITKYFAVSLALYLFLFIMGKVIYSWFNVYVYTIILGILGVVFYLICLYFIGFNYKKYINMLKKKK